MPDDARVLDYTVEHEVTPLELFFDLVFVFALTQSGASVKSKMSMFSAMRCGLTDFGMLRFRARCASADRPVQAVGRVFTHRRASSRSR